MACAKGISLLKFVGTISLGLLTGVSYSVSCLSLPAFLRLSSSASAYQAVKALTASLKMPICLLTSFAAAPLLLSFSLSPRSARHPYLVYSSLLAIFSSLAPRLLQQPTRESAKKAPPRNKLEASYEVLGDANSEATSEAEIEDINGEEVRAKVDSLVKAYATQAALALGGFAMAVVGIWGDGAS